MADQVIRETAAYRKFRGRVIADIAAETGLHQRNHSRDKSPPIQATSPSEFHVRRELIERFRDVLLREVQRGGVWDEDERQCIQHALGLPSGLPVALPGWGAALLLRILGLRNSVAWRRAIRLLRSTKTYEGRQFVYENHVKASLRQSNWFGRDEDWVIRHMDDLDDEQTWHKLASIGQGMLKSLRQIGLREPKRILSLFARPVGKLDRDLLMASIHKGLIRSEQDLLRLNDDAYHVERYVYRHSGYVELEACIDLLRNAGVYDEHLFSLLKLPNWDHRDLDLTLNYLQRAGITDIGALLEELGAALWQAEPKSWKYAVEVLNARSVDDFAIVQHLLTGNRLPPAPSVEALYACGFTLSDIAQCQAALADAHQCHDLTERLITLTSAPWHFQARHLQQCKSYLKRGDADLLRAHLSVLSQREFEDPDAALAFQDVYPIDAKRLDRWLDLAGPFCKEQGALELGKWVSQLESQRPVVRDESLAYLVQSLSGVNNLDSLVSVGQLAAIGQPLLRFLVEQRRLGTLKKLHAWYKGDGRGAHELHWGSEDALLIPLFEDAYLRKSCAALLGNAHAVIDALSALADEVVGPQKYMKEEGERKEYWMRRDQVQRHVKSELTQHIRKVLADSNGIVLSSLLQAAYQGEIAYQEAKARLPHLMEDLLAGGGGMDDELSPLACDAFAHVYGIPVSKFKSEWLRIPSLQSQLAKYKIKNGYGLTWRFKYMKAKQSFDQSQLTALAEIGDIASRYGIQLERKDYRFEGLQRKRIESAEADIQSLRHHIALLIALGSGSEMVSPWIGGRLQGLATLTCESTDAYEHLEAVHQLLTLTLSDALRERIASKPPIADTDEDAAALAAAMVSIKASQDSDGAALLAGSMENCLVAVARVADRWFSREKGKFDRDLKRDGTLPLTAIVSKDRAAYFARVSCELCTSHNTDMWEESRYAHLLIFDPAQMRLVGMAMLYFQRIPEIDRTKQSLIVRAFNLRKDMAQQYDEDSVVDGILGICEEIAVDNDFACVALPDDNGQHLLSNHDGISKSVKKRFIENAKARSVGRRGIGSRDGGGMTIFEGYETGNRDGAVDRLVLVWPPVQYSSDATGRDAEVLHVAV